VKTIKPRKQRRNLFQAPHHQRYKRFSAPLSGDLKKAHNTNALPVRRGDSVRIMRGDRKGFEGKVASVDRTNYRVFVEGVTREKVDGSTMPVPIHPSKVMITGLNLEDKWRREILERKSKKAEKLEEKAAEKEPKASQKEVKKRKGRRKTARKSGAS
jgi:large subunit ribosomal protein L24